MSAASGKLDQLHALLEGYGSVLVAYSGGVDSAFLTAVAHDVLGSGAIAVTAFSPSMSQRELRGAKELATSRGWTHRVVPTHEVAREEYARNDPSRCYWCKTELFEVLRPMARETGARILVGTNTDDLGDYRPGLVAADEHGVLAPLAEVGLSKAEIRSLSADLGLPTADKEASPCLASRFAYGVRVTPEGLRRIDRAEEALRGFGFGTLRVRDHGDLARIEVPLQEIPRAARMAEEISRALTELGFSYVSLDLDGFRSGSLNAVLEGPRIGPPKGAETPHH